MAGVVGAAEGPAVAVVGYTVALGEAGGARGCEVFVVGAAPNGLAQPTAATPTNTAVKRRPCRRLLRAGVISPMVAPVTAGINQDATC